MKKIILTIIILLLYLHTFSQIRTNTEAEQICNTWLATLQANNSSMYPETGLTIGTYETETKNSKPIYYIFNLEPSGFIIVSGDSRIKAILAYSTKSNFPDGDDIPPALINLLEWYKKQIIYTIENDLQLPAYVIPNSETINNIGPLLNTIWGQSNEYAYYCPNNFAGCEPVAMGQIMKYYNHPSRGLGSQSYTGPTTLYANFGETYYQWTSMSNELSSSSSQNEIDAVAGLLFHCGVATHTDYQPQGAGTLPANAAKAYNNFFA